MKKKPLNLKNKFTIFKPERIILLSFVGLILLGTSFLMLPISTTSGKVLNFIDALFLSTSATCVTGLNPLSLADDFTIFGQLVVLLLIQIGGISIMTLYSSMTILLGRSIAVRELIIMQDLMDISSIEDFFLMITKIIQYTLFIELWGGIILTIAFHMEGFELTKAFYYGFFHSISAFCNAGFSLFNGSLEAYATNPFIHGTIAVLVILGGLGFIVLRELSIVIRGKMSINRLGFHTKIVLITSFILTILGMMVIFFGEFLGALDGYSLWEKIQISFFQSVTLRTAGFNTIPISSFQSYTIYAMALFMFIGGSPGSTAGGLKTTTLAILFRSILSTVRGEGEVSIFKRKISSMIIVRATALTFIFILTTSLFIFFLIGIESEQGFMALFFETISAIGTVGLSLGVTPILSTMGKLAIVALMLIGRIGPLTLILAIGQKHKIGKFDYPNGRIIIG